MKNWDLQVHFKVHGKGKDLFGDGMVIWYAKDHSQPGPVFGSKDFFHGLAVILDTYSNHNGPHNVSFVCVCCSWKVTIKIANESLLCLEIDNSGIY